MAGAISASIMTSYWEHAAIIARVGLVGDLHPQALGPHVSPAVVEYLVQSQAVMLSTNHMFMVTAIAIGFAAFAIWFAPKPANRGQMGGGG